MLHSVFVIIFVQQTLSVGLEIHPGEKIFTFRCSDAIYIMHYHYRDQYYDKRTKILTRD